MTSRTRTGRDGEGTARLVGGTENGIYRMIGWLGRSSFELIGDKSR